MTQCVQYCKSNLMRHVVKYTGWVSIEYLNLRWWWWWWW